MNPSSNIRNVLIDKHITKTSVVKDIEPSTELEIAGNIFECLNLPNALPIPIQNKKIKELQDKTYDYSLDFLNKGRPKKF